jgi:hypothetical protein
MGEDNDHHHYHDNDNDDKAAEGGAVELYFLFEQGMTFSLIPFKEWEDSSSHSWQEVPGKEIHRPAPRQQ